MLFTDRVIGLAEGNVGFVSMDRAATGSTTTTSLCYLASDGAPGIVYEVKAAHKDAFAVTKESLLDTSTKETAAADDVVAEH
mgnify:FL=1